MESLGIGWEQIIITLLVFAAGGIGARRVIKQDNAWEKIVQSQAITISGLKGEIRDLQRQVDALHDELRAEHELRIRVEARLEAVEAELVAVEKRRGYHNEGHAEPDNVREFKPKNGAVDE